MHPDWNAVMRRLFELARQHEKAINKYTDPLMRHQHELAALIFNGLAEAIDNGLYPDG